MTGIEFGPTLGAGFTRPGSTPAGGLMTPPLLSLRPEAASSFEGCPLGIFCGRARYFSGIVLIACRISRRRLSQDGCRAQSKNSCNNKRKFCLHRMSPSMIFHSPTPRLEVRSGHKTSTDGPFFNLRRRSSSPFFSLRAERGPSPLLFRQRQWRSLRCRADR